MNLLCHYSFAICFTYFIIKLYIVLFIYYFILHIIADKFSL